MKEFDEKSYCPKCGSEDIAARYVRKNEYSIIDGDMEAEEHIRRTCKRCMYQWNEAPLDAALKDREIQRLLADPDVTAYVENEAKIIAREYVATVAIRETGDE